MVANNFSKCLRTRWAVRSIIFSVKEISRVNFSSGLLKSFLSLIAVRSTNYT